MWLGRGEYCQCVLLFLYRDLIQALYDRSEVLKCEIAFEGAHSVPSCIWCVLQLPLYIWSSQSSYILS